MIIVKYRPLLSWVLVLPLILGGCSDLSVKHDDTGYEHALALKAETLVLMDKATESFSIHKPAVDVLKGKLDKVYEDAQGKPANEGITDQWAAMKDPERRLLGGFLVRWENKDKLMPEVISGAKSNISLGFDQIIGLEKRLSGKN